MGDEALSFNTGGNTNTAIGTSALGSNTKGHSNVALGAYAFATNTVTPNLVAVGDSALLNLKSTTGHCTAVGSQAGILNTTGGNNTYVGYHAGNTITTGNSNTIIGYRADVNSGNIVNATAIGNLAVSGANNRVRIGNNSVTSIGGQVGWTNFSDERIKTSMKDNVPGLAFINLLKPVTYHFNIDKQGELTGRRDETQSEGKYDINQIQFTGFLAQDVAAAEKINYDFSGVDAPKNNNDVYGLRYARFCGAAR